MDDYLFFPIELLRHEQIKIKQVTQDIFDYCLFEYCVLNDLDFEEYELAGDYFGLIIRNKESSYSNGKRLYEQVNEGVPKASVRKDLLFDFHKHTKTEDEINCFLAFAALKSILQKKPCQRITNAYLLSRMGGYAKSIDLSQLPARLKKFQKRYWIDKLKRDLELDWGLKIYGIHARGAYVSFKMEYEQLMVYAEKRRKLNRVKELAEKKKVARSSFLSKNDNSELQPFGQSCN